MDLVGQVVESPITLPRINTFKLIPMLWLSESVIENSLYWKAGTLS